MQKEKINHSEYVGLRLTPKEVAELERVQKKRKFSTVSQTVRYLLFDKNWAFFSPETDSDFSAADKKMLQAAELFYPEFKLVETRCRKYCDVFIKVANSKNPEGEIVMTEAKLERNILSIQSSLNRLATLLNGVLECCGSDKRVGSITPLMSVEDSEKSQTATRKYNPMFHLNIKYMNLERITIRGKVYNDAKNVGTEEKPRYRFTIMTMRIIGGMKRFTCYLVYTDRKEVANAAKKDAYFIVSGRLNIVVSRKEGKNYLFPCVESDFIQSAGDMALYNDEIILHGRLLDSGVKYEADGKKMVRFNMAAKRLTSNESFVETVYTPFAEESKVPPLVAGNSLFVMGYFDASIDADKEGAKPELIINATEIQLGGVE